MGIIKNLVALLLIIGGLNWGLIGLSDYDLVQALFGSVPEVARIVYLLIGLAAVLAIVPYIKKMLAK